MRAYCAADPAFVRELDGLSYTPLMAACGAGRNDVARVLLEAGADPAQPGFAGRTLAERLGPTAMREVLRTD